MSGHLVVPQQQRPVVSLPSSPRAGAIASSPRLAGAMQATRIPSPRSPSPQLPRLPTPNGAYVPPRPQPYEPAPAPALYRSLSGSSTVSSTSTKASLDSVSTKAGSISSVTKINEKYAISPDPSFWKEYQDYDLEDPDDFLHNPDPKNYSRGHIFTRRGFVNLGCLFILFMGILGVFAIYPITTFVLKDDLSDFGAFNIGGINATGQVSTFLGRGLIDPDTPQAEHTITSFNTGEEWDLVFSDEFNVEGRSFYPGDDPYWEAVDLHYYQTSNLEWYDPQQVVTTNGAMRIWFNQTKNHDLNFMGGMVSTWNKFCFTGGMVLASVSLPGSPKLSGLWPAVWTMGNLGRAGYGASLEGMWPYQGYDECDKGTLANQTLPGDTVIPTNGDPQNQGLLSFLPGQRLSRCTCTDDTSHPGPRHDDGTFVGRSSPEIDILEATIGPSGGVVSQSAQFGPFDDGYQWDESKATIANASNTIVNGYHGGVFQEAVSALSMTNQNAYTQLDGPTVFATYGYEYKPGYEGSYISWINNGVLSWTMDGDAVAANEAAGISHRAVSQEPMYIIANLGMSPTFGRIDPNLLLPVHMDIDWIRVYQPRGAYNVGCDPPEMPTLQYINDHFEAYNNPNLTVFSESPGAPSFPGNRLLGQCPNEA